MSACIYIIIYYVQIFPKLITYTIRKKNLPKSPPNVETHRVEPEKGREKGKMHDGG